VISWSSGISGSDLLDVNVEMRSTFYATLLSQRMAEESATSEAAVATTNQLSNNATAEESKASLPSAYGPNCPVPNPLSKSQQKKQKRKQDWEDSRDSRKALRKEKNKARKERKRERAAQEPDADVDADADGSNVDSPADIAKNVGDKGKEQKKGKGYATAVQLPITFIFDCDFDEFMHDGEVMSLGSQLTRAYSDNKKASFRAHLAVSSYGGRLKARFEGILANQHKNWKGFHFLEEDFMQVAEKAQQWMRDPKTGGELQGALAPKSSDSTDKVEVENSKTMEEGQEDQGQDETHQAEQEHPDGEIVYLTADSPNTLHELSPYSTYIIGGIIDRNRHKGICYQRAEDRGVKTAKLPIGQFMEMQSRQVLATNHVNEIMIKWLEEGDWGRAFLSVIPKRKGGKLKGDKNGKAGKGNGAKSADRENDFEEEDEEDEEENVLFEGRGEKADVDVKAGKPEVNREETGGSDADVDMKIITGDEVSRDAPALDVASTKTNNQGDQQSSGLKRRASDEDGVSLSADTAKKARQDDT